ncbi:MAG: hypothetical protein IJ306_04510 [Oscillospiraceae bacterium]|nr:hypothetical protein [Oscillospiraceae bacterium]
MTEKDIFITDLQPGIAFRILSLLISALLLWFSAGLIDYMLVMHFYREPFFCVANVDENGGFYHGLGYSYVITGNFDEENSEDPFGAEYIEFEIFGKRAETLIRHEERKPSED